LVHPDGCADLLFDESGKIYISGIAGKSRPLNSSLGVALRGLRLRPGAIPLCFGVPASAFLNQVIPVADISAPLARTMTDVGKQADGSDELVGAAVKLLSQVCYSGTWERRLTFALTQVSSKPLRAIAPSLGISERHLRRFFLREVGVGVSRLKRIHRLQRTIDAMRHCSPGFSMAGLAVDQGFFDQAHMNHEVKELTGMTPSALHHSLAPGETSERYKTHPFS
jgi:AraC-like DNA-binding protein